MFSRQDFFISKSLKTKISSCKILIIGCGMGSQVAHLLVRSGFQNITICDGDNFEPSNKNRQFCSDNDLGKNKAESTGFNLLKINSQLNIKIIPHFLSGTMLKDQIQDHDYIINTIDFDSPEFLNCSNYCRKYNKKELFPINLGFDGCVCFFDKTSPTFTNFFKIVRHKALKKKIIQFLIEKKGTKEMKIFLKKYYKIPPLNDPQTGVSTFINAAIITKIIMKDLEKKKTLKFPDFYYNNGL